MVGKGREELLSFPAGVLSSLSWSPVHKWVGSGTRNHTPAAGGCRHCGLGLKTACIRQSV